MAMAVQKAQSQKEYLYKIRKYCNVDFNHAELFQY